MSFEYYAKWWILSKEAFEYLYRTDLEMVKKSKVLKRKLDAQNLVGSFYAKYSMILQDLDACLDQMALAQKRLAVQKLVDVAVMRFYELAELLKGIEFSEYHYVDGNLIELKLVPYDVEVLHPSLFVHRPIDIEDLIQKIKRGERIFDPPVLQEEEEVKEESEAIEPEPEIQTEEEQTLPFRPKRRTTKRFTIKFRRPTEMGQDLTDEEKQKLFISEQICLIQTAERARQCRSYCFEQYKPTHLRKKTLFEQIKEDEKEEAEEMVETPQQSAQTILRYWKKYRAKKRLKEEEKRRRLLIGMSEPNWRSHKEFEVFDENLKKRREYRDQRIREYVDTINEENARILRVRKPGLFEDIGDEIREWFKKWYDISGNFDDFPTEAQGGSILIVRGETMTFEQYLKEGFKTAKQKKAEAKEKKKADQLRKAEQKKVLAAEKAKKAAEAAKLRAKLKKKKFDEFEFEFKETATVPMFQEGLEEYNKIFDERPYTDNPLEKEYVDIITDEIYYQLQLSVRKDVDEMMRMELELLKQALAKDTRKKYKKPKKAKKKKKKGKKVKDMTKNRTIEDLFQELVTNGIIRQYPIVRLDSYFGDFSYKTWNLRNHLINPPAALLDVRQAVALNCILPLGVQSMMKKPKSVLIVGPRQTGKHLLANAIFNETNCVLFDCSPENTAGKYPGKKGVKMLSHLISKMSKILQPSIIYFERAERVFYKKVPKQEKQLEPTKLGKVLLKQIVKPILPNDRILVLGITNAPWTANRKIIKVFERSILIPRPDYNSLYMYWRHLIMRYSGVDRDFNFSAMTSATVYYTYSDIKKVVDEVLTPRRIINLFQQPLTQQELLEVFIKNNLEMISEKEYKKFEKWYSKTSLGKQLKSYNAYCEQTRSGEKPGKKK